MRPKETLFIFTHPGLTIRTKRRQSASAVEFQGQPTGAFIKTFHQLPLYEAAKLFQAEEQRRIANLPGPGVPEDAWSTTDQKRMSQGQYPIHYPEHPNV